MDDNIRRMVERISSISDEAKIVAERLLVRQSVSSADDKDVQIAQLRALISDLKEELDMQSYDIEDDVDLTDQEETSLRDVFSKTLDKMPTQSILGLYGAHGLRSYAPNIRVILCSCLNVEFEKRKITPDPLWHSIIVNNGAILP